MFFLGVDPGAKGAFVMLDESGTLVCSERLPIANGELVVAELVDTSLHYVTRTDAPDEICVTVELVKRNPKWGAGNFAIGMNYGMILAAFIALGVPTQRVLPTAWQKAMLAGRPKAKGKALKESAVSVARERWPSLPLRYKADWGRADAALIAEYGRRLWKGEVR